MLTRLSFNYNELSSEFPGFITDCWNLTYLDLSKNHLTGAIPELLFSNLGNLVFLNLTSNLFQGPLSSNISRLSKLQDLRLGQNRFSGPIPEQIGLLSDLQILDLKENALNSTIPSELGFCTNLTFLALATNSLSGAIPLSFTDLNKLSDLALSVNLLSGEISPYFMTNWTDLISLQVQENNFTGIIPPEIGLLEKLNYLFLCGNEFHGSIPSEMGNLKELLRLDLSRNRLSGPIPSVEWNLTKLTILRLYDNQLTGTIPPQIGNLTSLTDLELSINKLHGELPETLSLLSKLERLSVLDNNFSGTIPTDFGKKSPNLQYVHFSNNIFSGELPPGLCSGFALKNLTADGDNNFTGPLPDCLRNCTGLTRVRLDGNQFTGDISIAFGVHPSLDFISLSGNRFSGELSPDWGLCQSLTRLQVDGNKISGEIPVELGKLSQLRYLSLDNNELNGQIPVELENLRHLFNLSLSGNHLTGDIPKFIGSLTDLSYLNLAGNNFSGRIPNELGNCERLLSLNLGNNNLSGEIPPELGNLLALQIFLDLSSNSLSGTIPSDLGKLNSLENLNLSHNHLTGIIPSLSGMISLNSSDFSYNDLTGQIPTADVFKNAIYTGNSGLCGDAEGLSPCSSSTPSRKSNNKTKIVLAIVIPVCGLSFLVFAIGAILILRRATPHYGEEIQSIEKDQIATPLIWERLRLGKLKFGDIVKATEEFSEKFFIGKGGFGTVYKAELPTGQIVAVKRLDMLDSGSYLPATNRQSFENEILTLTEVQHWNIIKLHGFHSRNGFMYLIYNYIERGSLGKVLYGEEGNVELGWATRVRIVQGVAHALAYLHHDCSPPIVHRDVTLNNILLESDFEPRLSDFGTARLLDPNTSNWTAVAGSYGYMAPGKMKTYLYLFCFIIITCYY